MSELSSLLTSLRDLGSKELSVLISDTASSLHIGHLDGTIPEHLLGPLADSPIALLTKLAPQGKDFKKVTIICSTPAVTYIPDGLYDHSMDKEYMDMVFGESRSTSIRVGHIPSMSIHYLFRIDNSLSEYINEHFPHGHLTHLCEPLLIDSWANQRHDEELLFRLHLQGKDLFMLVLRGKETCLASHQHIGDPTDVVYHALNTAHAFGVDHDQAHIVCSGALSQSEEGFKLLQSYCPNTEYKQAKFSSIVSQEQFILATQSYCA